MGSRDPVLTGARTAATRESGAAVRYVCLPGAAFTGSTLLGFLLNTHPSCVSVGAATGLIARVQLDDYRCSCGELFLECKFWQSVVNRTRRLGEPVDVYRTGMWETHFAPTRLRYLDAALIRSLRRTFLNEMRDAVVQRVPLVQRRLRDARSQTWALARAVLEETKTEVFVDTARDHLRPKMLAADPRFDVRVIHLVKDVRANAASTMKHTDASAAEGARIWRRANLEADRNRRYLPPGRWLRLRYDELCRDVQGTLDRIADFLEVPRAALPEDFRSVSHHIIGNTMRLRSRGSVREDTSWRERLSGADLRVVARIAGAENRAFGFDWPGSSDK